MVSGVSSSSASSSSSSLGDAVVVIVGWCVAGFGDADSVVVCGSVVGWWIGSGTTGVVGVSGVVKKHRSVAVVGVGRGALLFWQLLKHAHEVQRVLATLQGQAIARAVGLDRAQVDDLEQSQQRWRT